MALEIGFKIINQLVGKRTTKSSREQLRDLSQAKYRVVSIPSSRLSFTFKSQIKKPFGR